MDGKLKPAKEVTAGARKAAKVSGGNNNPGPQPSKVRVGTNRGSGGAQGR